MSDAHPADEAFWKAARRGRFDWCGNRSIFRAGYDAAKAEGEPAPTKNKIPEGDHPADESFQAWEKTLSKPINCRNRGLLRKAWRDCYDAREDRFWHWLRENFSEEFASRGIFLEDDGGFSLGERKADMGNPISGWRPISEAPKEGDVLLFIPGLGRRVGYWEEDGGGWRIHHPRWPNFPTHFQPLPEAPGK